MDPTTNYTFRPYQKGDETQIVDLFRLCIGNSHWDYWRWLNQENPFGQSKIYCVFDGKKLIAHYALVLMKAKVGDRVFDCGLGVDAMTHPDYRRQGLFYLIAKKTLEEAGKEGMTFALAVPNRPIAIEGNYKIGYYKASDINLMEFDLGKEVPKLNSSLEIKEKERFEDEVDDLWAEVSKNFDFATVRTKNYLNWRFQGVPKYVDEKREYTKFFVYKKGKLAGYAVTKVYQDKSRGAINRAPTTSTANRKGKACLALTTKHSQADPDIKAHIVDILFKNEAAFESLLQAFFNYAQANQAGSLSLWMLPNCSYRQLFLAKNFTETFATGLIIHDNVLNFSKKHLKLDGNLLLSMVDTDIF